MSQHQQSFPIRVLLVDDHLVVRQGLRAFLSSCVDIEVCGEAGSGAEAITQAAELHPDVVVMDVRMPGGHGIEATRSIKEANQKSKIIILTSYMSPEYVEAAIRAGALSYLMKDAGPVDILHAIRAAARNESVLHPEATAHLMKLAIGDHTPTPMQELSTRELEVLRALAEGWSNAYIADRLFLSEKTVKTHVSSILSKLDVSDRTQAAVLAWRHGLMKKEP